MAGLSPTPPPPHPQTHTAQQRLVRTNVCKSCLATDSICRCIIFGRCGKRDGYNQHSRVLLWIFTTLASPEEEVLPKWHPRAVKIKKIKAPATPTSELSNDGGDEGMLWCSHNPLHPSIYISLITYNICSFFKFSIEYGLKSLSLAFRICWSFYSTEMLASRLSTFPKSNCWFYYSRWTGEKRKRRKARAERVRATVQFQQLIKSEGGINDREEEEGNG